MRRVLLVICVAAGLLAAGLWASSEAGAELKVLPKGTSRDQLKQVMKAQAKALGVECDYCHDQPDMAKETEKKLLARRMMLMVRSINQQLRSAGIKREATCATCHRGQAKPPQ